MTRAGLLLLAIVLAGCRPPAPAPATPATQPPPPVQPQTPIDEPTEPPELAVIEREPAVMPPDRTPLDMRAPPGVAANQTACEQSCAEVHDCAVIDRAYTPAAAAAIEVGCLGACVTNEPPVTSLFGCTRPTAIEPNTCAPFLACLGPVWPEPDAVEIPTSIVQDARPGCERGCEAYARCYDPSTPLKLITSCVSKCRERLTVEQERGLGTCADLENCEEILACVNSTPGA